MSAMAAVRCVPNARADGSLKAPVSVAERLAVDAGVGVAGTSPKRLLDMNAGAGAAGGAGVEVTIGAGVDGGRAKDAVVDEVAGTTFGYLMSIL